MHIEIDEKTFALHLARVKHAIASKAPQVISTALTIEATESKVIFKACDLAIEILSVVDSESATVITPGTISIIEKEIPRLYGLKSIQVPIDSKQAWFYCTTGKTRVGLLDGEEYPRINFTAGETISISSSLLLEGFEAVEFAATTDEYKQTWASIYLQIQNSVIRFMAGESQRMALFCMKNEQEVQDTSCMVASSAIKAVISFLRLEQGEVKLAMRKEHGMMKIEDSQGGYILCRTLAGQYPGTIMPEYIQQVPARPDALKREILFSVSDLLKILEILEPSATAASNRLKVHVCAEDQTMKLWAQTDGKESFQEIPVIVKGESLEVCVNFVYLLSNLKNIKDKEGVMELFGDRLPFFLRPHSEKDLVIVTAVMAPALA
jgi:DNA polymerase III sliding clamp (beta) subunit (PCNA family)